MVFMFYPRGLNLCADILASLACFCAGGRFAQRVAPACSGRVNPSLGRRSGYFDPIRNRTLFSIGQTCSLSFGLLACSSCSGSSGQELTLHRSYLGHSVNGSCCLLAGMVMELTPVRLLSGVQSQNPQVPAQRLLIPLVLLGSYPTLQVERSGQ